MVIKDAPSQNQTIRHYYQFQSTIYDLTRWSFLFGRNDILRCFPKDFQPQRILEVGCGTGSNLKKLVTRFPQAQITGFDVSGDMLQIARKKMAKYDHVLLQEKPYGYEATLPQPDLILFSYVLTMVNPQYSSLILQAYRDLAPGGKIAVVDFHSSAVPWFKKHMSNHHVRMDGHLDDLLNKTFTPRQFEVRKAYQGLWNYFLFVGETAVG